MKRRGKHTYKRRLILLWHGMLSEHVRKTCMWFHVHFLSTVCIWLLCEKKHKCFNIIINLVAPEREGVNIIDHRIDSFRQICEQCQLETAVNKLRAVRLGNMQLLGSSNRSWLFQMLWMKLEDIELTENSSCFRKHLRIEKETMALHRIGAFLECKWHLLV